MNKRRRFKAKRRRRERRLALPIRHATNPFWQRQPVVQADAVLPQAMENAFRDTVAACGMGRLREVEVTNRRLLGTATQP